MKGLYEIAFFSLFLVASVSGNLYFLHDSIVGSAFYDAFTFEGPADPSHGRVNYVNKTVAQAQNLTFASSNAFILRADFKTVLSATGPGRNSVRIQSIRAYTRHVAIFNVRHMPQGCATWPAIWETTASNWPNGGEVDVLEGVNDQAPNAATLHTSANCTMPANRTQSGTNLSLDCNKGCGVRFNAANSFGPTFNNNGGGWYAVERTTTFIKVWFWARNDTTVPPNVKTPGSTVNTDGWGKADASFPGTACDMATHFSSHHIIINLTLCGDWAGNVYRYSGCPSTCTDFVNKNPSAFTNAYFDIASLRVYV